jgi:thymidylate synthase
MAYLMDPYDDALEQIIKHGAWKTNRTGVRTLAIFGIQSRYRIEKDFPLLTRRKIWPKAVFGELLTFISGKTRNADFVENGCNFWTPWVDERWAKSKGYEPDAFGPVYGFNFRYFGGNYNKGIEGTGYGHGGFDQLAYMMYLLRKDPDNRRILFSLWNPAELDNMRLPPCHYTFQCFVQDSKLSGMLTQRSCDFPVGVPANIQFYSAFIYMLAQQCGYEPYEFVHSTVDSHIYENQMPAVEEYLSREKLDSPQLILHKADDIESYKLEDFEIVNYNPLPPIEVPVAV